MAHILIATLGDSPVVVTAMYKLLTEQEGIQIDKVVVLHPSGGLIPLGFDLIEEALNNKCEVQAALLDFEDANSEEECYKFLQRLYSLLAETQKNGDMVYLSLAGGRKNMSAITGLLVPLFPNVKSLYHILDKHESSERKHTFKSYEELVNINKEDREPYFFPDREQLKLVPIPYGEQQLVSDEFRGRLHTITDEEDLDELYEIAADEAEAIDFTKQITDPNETIRILEVLLTEHAAEQFRAIWHHDRPNAKEFKLCFERMRFATQLRTLSHDIYSRKLSKGEHDIYSQDLSSLTFHFGKRRRTTQRPVFHTVPKDIKNCADKEVDRVIISELEMKANGKYRQLEQIITSLAFPLGPFMAVNELIAKLQKSTQEPSIILVPLGATPMIATQFYTLRTAEGQTIREVVLLYPSGMPAMRQSAEVAKSAFDDEKIACRSIPIPELKDIDSKDACEIYEKKLEETIDDICQRHSGVQIDLLLSGGRKGMAALAMFVAQRKGIRYLYHTLINDVELNRRVEEETKVSALNLVKIDRRERNNRLFLRAYEGEGPYEKFVCFKIPVLPGGKK